MKIAWERIIIRQKNKNKINGINAYPFYNYTKIPYLFTKTFSQESNSGTSF